MRPVWLLVLVGCDAATPVARGPHTLYQVTGETVPTAANEDGSLGLDLDGNGSVENQLGTAFRFLVYYGFGDPQGGTDEAVMTGKLQLTFDVEYDSTSHDLANVTAFAMNAQQVTAPDAIEDPLSGWKQGKLLDVGPGKLPLVIAPFGVPIVLPLEDAHVQALADADALHAIVGGSFDPAIAHEQLVPQWAQALGAILARDCAGTPPTCGCAASSPGLMAIEYFDLNHDCAITADELEANSLVQSVLAPDFPMPGTSSVKRISVGVAIDATVVPPT